MLIEHLCLRCSGCSALDRHRRVTLRRRVEGLIALYGMYAARRGAQISDAVPALLVRPARSFEAFVTEYARVFR